MSTVQEQIESFKDFEPARVVRNGQAYVETSNFIRSELERLLGMYKKLTKVNQTGRLTRDQIDNLLRRYHDYVIAGKYVAHYRQKGLKIKKGNIFEHVIPQRTIRNMLIAGVITIDQALNAPTCLISKDMNDILTKNKLTKTTPNKWWYWQRYTLLAIEIETYDGTPVDQTTWNLATHWEYFKV